MRRSGFTLLEVMLVVALVGLIFSGVLFPIQRLTVNLASVRERGKIDNALRETFMLIDREARQSVNLGKDKITFKVEHRELLGSELDDRLLFVTMAPAQNGNAAGVSVYGLYREGLLSEGYPEGLYRWVIPGGLVEEIETDELLPEDGWLVLPEVTGFKVQVLDTDSELSRLFADDQWKGAYSGGTPKAIKVTFVRDGEEVVYEDWLPLF